MPEITIPHNFTPRPYQMPLLKAMDSGTRRACLVWHRRAGKDKCALNLTIKKMFERVGTYFHALPTYNQGRKVLWDGRGKDEFKFMDHFPPEIIARRNSTEMKIELVNGSIWQVIGADNYDSVVGSNPVGIVFSEYSVSERYPMAWDYFRPMLTENGGWAIFIFTPRGRNHGFELYQQAAINPSWFTQILTVEDTKAIGLAEIDEDRRAGMSEDMIQQEYYCSFLAATESILIPPMLIEEARRRNVNAYSNAPRVAGLDVARFGDDRTAFVIRQAHKIVHIDAWKGLDTVKTCGRVQEAYRMKMFDVVCVDAIGLGAGVADILKASKIPTVAVNVAESASSDEKYQRQRDELWFKVRAWFEERICGFDIACEPRMVAALIADISDIHYDYSPSGRRIVESKDDMKKRSHLGQSPDIGDALCMTFGNWHWAYQDERAGANYRPEVDEETYNPLTYGLRVRSR